MDEKRLKDLVCPAKKNKHLCGGELKLKRSASYTPTSFLPSPLTSYPLPNGERKGRRGGGLRRGGKRNSSEILEGILRCNRCKAEYPILLGIPILMENIKKYLRENYYYLTGVSRLNGNLSQKMHSYLMSQILLTLKSPKEKLFPKQRRYNRNTASNFLRGSGSSLLNHYDNLMDIVNKDEPLYDFFHRYAQKSPYLVLEEMAQKYANGKEIAVEVGCGVGGLTAKLSRFYNFAYGVDTSLEILLLARRIIKGLPEGLNKYRIYQERNKYYFRSINIKKGKNVEFICASGNSLPFRDKSIDAVCSCNLIDVVKEPRVLLQEKIRILKNKGMFLISDPYDFQPSRMKEFPGQRRKPAIEVIKEGIKKKIKIVEERDNIPWITRSYKRNYGIYFNHCLAGIRKDENPKRR